VPQSQELRSKARIEDPTEPESSRLGQYKLREDDLIKPTKKGLSALEISVMTQSATGGLATTFLEPF